MQYASAAGGYVLEAPEGWARTEHGSDVSFVDKFDGVQVTLTDAANAPTAATDDPAVDAIRHSGRSVETTAIETVELPGGTAVRVDYTSNSEPDAVTGKQVRLENQAFLFFRGSRLATLRVWAPQGADNVDQWQRISQSFQWQ